MIEAILNYNFMKHALIAAVLSSVVCGIIGTIITQKRLVNISGGIAHASFGGIGLGYYLGFEPIIGGMLFAILSAFSITTIKRNTSTKTDTLVGIFWSFGMALGILFIALTPGYPPDMTSYLFGDILTVSRFYIYVMIVFTLIILATITSIFNYWKTYLFDEEFTKTLKINVTLLEYLLYILVSISIIILIKVVGIILVIALLTIPPAIVSFFTKNFVQVMIYSSLLGVFLSLSGIYLSYEFNIPSGATIILLSAFTYFIVYVSQKYIIRRTS